MNKKLKIVLTSAFLVVALLFCLFFAYTQDYYKAVDVEKYLEGSESVSVSEIEYGYLFDGPGEKSALIFYPGGKVEETAYAPLLSEIAEGGVDCFLVKMPARLAVFGINKAEKIMTDYSYDSWYLSGHSLGGAMACSYAEKHAENISGLYLLGAYSTYDLSNAPFSAIVIYGSNDMIVNREKLEAGFSLIPPNSERVVINGGNHSQFGSYGFQKGDGKAQITKEEQWEITSGAILSDINKK